MQALQYDSYGGGAAGLKVILFSFYHFFLLILALFISHHCILKSFVFHRVFEFK